MRCVRPATHPQKGIVRVWDDRTLNTVKAYMHPLRDEIGSVAATESLLFLACKKQLAVLDLRVDGLFIRSPLVTHDAEDDINRIRLDPARNRYGFCDDTGSVSLFRFTTHERSLELPRIHKNVAAAAHLQICSDFVIGRNENFVYSAGLDMCVIKSKTWNPSPKTKYEMARLDFGKIKPLYTLNPPMVHSIDLNRKGNMLMLACGDGNVCWATTGGLTVKKTFEVSNSVVHQALVVGATDVQPLLQRRPILYGRDDQRAVGPLVLEFVFQGSRCVTHSI